MSNQVERVYKLEMLAFNKDQRIKELEKELAALKVHSAESDKELCQIADALGLKDVITMPIMEKLRDMIAKIGELGDELAYLKTPHRCCDCENYRTLTRNCYGATGVRVESCKIPWLCGHFQKKGTK